jgi:hypothetical protein
MSAKRRRLGVTGATPAAERHSPRIQSTSTSACNSSSPLPTLPTPSQQPYTAPPTLQNPQWNSPPPAYIPVGQADMPTNLPPARMQYVGDFKGATWNSQALLARRTHRQSPKRRHAIRLINSHDFLGMQETHSTRGATDAYETRLPSDVRCFWSHESTRQAGITIWVQKTISCKIHLSRS